MEESPLYQVFVQDYTRLCVLAGGILRDEALAQDAVQESWLQLQALRHLNTEHPEKLRHLVMIAVRHTAYNMLRKQSPVPVEEAVLTARCDDDRLPEEQAEYRDTMQALMKALQMLEETDRTILQLQYGQELSSRQIAQITGLRPAAVRPATPGPSQKKREPARQAPASLACPRPAPA